MKPLMLKFKGINSFTTEQVIHFNKVTHDGIFAIFGPTGSGKSSIIDCITIALYDEPSRYKAKGKEFVNINANEAYIIFEFEYDGVYRIEKTYKRTKEKVEIRSAKLIDITDTNNTKVLADKISDLTAKIQNILGLKYDNFVRSVILPQDQFSKFLFLEGKERNDMLSELLGYNKLNDKIKRKLSLKKQLIKDELNALSAEMKVSEHINDELIEEKIKCLTKAKIDLVNNDKKLEECEQEFKKLEEIKSFIEDKEKKILELNTLTIKENDINEYKNKIGKYERIKDISEEINDYAKIKQSLIELKQQVDNLFVSINESQEQTNAFKENYDNAINNKALYYEQKINEKAMYTNLLDSQEKLKEITISTDNLRETYKELFKQYNEKNSEMEKLEETLLGIEESLKLYTNSKKENFVEQDIKKTTGEAVSLYEKFLNNKELFISLKVKKESELVEKQKIEQEFTVLNERMKAGMDALEKIGVDIADLLKQPTKEQYRVLEAKNIENTLIFNAAMEYDLLTKQGIELIAEKNKLTDEIETLQNDIISLKSSLDIEKKKMHLHELKGILKEGEACPLCGSTVHDKKDINNNYVDEQYVFLCNELSIKEGLLETVKAENQDIIVKIEVLENKKVNELSIFNGKELKEPYSEVYLKDMLENVENTEKIINELEEKKREIKEMIVNIEKSLISVQEQLKQADKTAVNYINEMEKLEILINEQEQALYELTNTLSINQFEDIKPYAVELSEKESAYNTALLEIEKLNIEKNKVADMLSEAKLQHSKLNMQLDEIKNKGQDFKKEQDEILAKINNVTKGQDLDSLITKTEQYIKKLVDDENVCKVNYEKENINLQTLIKSHEIKLLQIEEKQKTFDYVKVKLDKVKLYYNLASYEEINSWVLEPNDYQKMVSEVMDYDNQAIALKSEIDFLDKKIIKSEIEENTCITLYKAKLQDKDSLKATQKDLYSLISSLENEIDTMSKLYIRQGELLKLKDKAVKRQDLIMELDDLLKANKFFSYITSKQLQGIAVDASMRIKKITGGKYGIEVHENSFVIKDYFSEGAIRRVVTLSGGETFIFSLCLALALCTKISTRNKSSMDFFFLDEGFGSLDNDTLETVYSTLLSLKSQKITIGVISHVESLYERIDAKIIVKPSYDALKGSSIAVESFYND